MLYIIRIHVHDSEHCIQIHMYRCCTYVLLFQEVDCEYSFEWPTLLACPHKELECVAAGGKYDLRPLLHYRNWMVTTSGDYSIVVGGCRYISYNLLSLWLYTPASDIS